MDSLVTELGPKTIAASVAEIKSSELAKYKTLISRRDKLAISLCLEVAVCFYAKGDLPEAQKWLESAAKRNHFEARKELIKIYYLSNKEEEALRLLRAAANNRDLSSLGEGVAF